MCVSGGKKCSIFGKFDLICFLVTPGLRFALLPYYRRILAAIMSHAYFSFFILDEAYFENDTKSMYGLKGA